MGFLHPAYLFALALFPVVAPQRRAHPVLRPWEFNN